MVNSEWYRQSQLRGPGVTWQFLRSLQQDHLWRLCRAHPQGPLGFVWLLLGFLSSWHQVQGCAVGSDFDFLSLFSALCWGMVLREYRVWKASDWSWNFWNSQNIPRAELQSLQSFPSATQMDARSSTHATTLDVQILISPSKETWAYLYEVQSNSSGGGQNLWLREESFLNW